MRLVEIGSTVVVLYGLYLFACFLITYTRKRNVEIELAHVGDRVSEATRRRYADDVQAPPAIPCDARFLRGAPAERRRA